MKKLYTALTASVLIASISLIPLKPVCAEYVPDLQSLASSLGADTEYLNIPNFKHDDEERKILNSSYLSYLNTCSNYEALIYPDYYFSKALEGGSCFGISILEILAHNGIIKPSDIQNGAFKMNDIVYSEESDHFIAGYQAAYMHHELFYSILSSATGDTTQHQAELLINTAQKCMDEKRYFFIGCFTATSGHGIVGIGISDGHWEYNGKSYDKCVLTLDSNNSDGNGNAVPFNEETCIYVNSEKGNFYIPEYGHDSEDEFFIAVIEDDALLNYKGLISPTEQLTDDLSDANTVSLWYEPQVKYDIDIYDEKGNICTMPDADNNIQQFIASKTYFLKGNSFHIEPDTDITNRGIQTQKIRIVNQSGGFDMTAKDNIGNFDIKHDDFKITSRNNVDIRYEMLLRFNESHYPFSPHYNHCFFGHTDSYIRAEILGNGILLSSDSPIETIIDTFDVLFDKNCVRSNIQDNHIRTKIVSNNTILLSFDENDALRFYIDPDKNGIYDTPIQKGDVNSDGIIDGRDATMVLADYAKHSVENDEESYINEEMADYDCNSIVDGRDASAILTYYAKNSVNGGN